MAASCASCCVDTANYLIASLVLTVLRSSLQNNEAEAEKMKVKAERAKKMRQEMIKSKSRRSKAEKKAIEKGRISAEVPA